MTTKRTVAVAARDVARCRSASRFTVEDCAFQPGLPDEVSALLAPPIVVSAEPVELSPDPAGPENPPSPRSPLLKLEPTRANNAVRLATHRPVPA